MAAIVNPSLFSWNNVEARSDLDRFYLVRDNLPDGKSNKSPRRFSWPWAR